MSRIRTIGIVTFLGFLAPGLMVQANWEGQEDDQGDENGYAARVEEMMGEISWGMSPKQIVTILSKRIRETSLSLIKKTKGVIEQDRIMQKAQNEIQKLRQSYIKFNGKITGWDLSPIGPEFRHNSGESMLVNQENTSRDYYFFINGRLWKWYKEFKSEAFGNQPFEIIGEAMQRRFGQATPMNGDDYSRPWLEWSNRKTRTRMLNNGGAIALVFSSEKAERHLAVLRKNALPRKKKRNTALDDIIIETDEFGFPIKAQDPNDRIAEKIVKQRHTPSTPSAQ